MRWDGKGFNFIPQFLNRWRTFSQVLTYFFSSGKSKKNGENRRGRSVDYYPSQDKQLHLQKVDWLLGAWYCIKVSLSAPHSKKEKKNKICHPGLPKHQSLKIGQKHCSPSYLEHLTSAGGWRRVLGWAQREGWARDSTWLARGLCPHSDTHLSVGALSCNTPSVDPCSRNPATHSPLLAVDVQLFSTWPPKLTPGTQHQPPEGSSPSRLQGEGWCRVPQQSSPQTHFSLHASPLLPSPGCHGQGCLILLSSPSGGSGVLRVCVTWSLWDLSGSSESSVFLSCYIDS